MADLGSDIFFLSVAELGAKLREKEFSVTELTRAYADRLEQFGPRYNALALSLRHLAVKKAKDVEGDFKRGRIRSPLAGIPFAAKDLFSVEDQITAWGARPYAAQKFDYTATVLRKLASADAVLLGKLAMVELAGGGGYRYASASLTGAGLNPWNRSYWAGGSSSGSGSAVAAGLVPFALGSETWGSILTPSSYCGITGLRPTYGLVSRHGAMALSWTMDKVGPMCRTADDCGLVLHAIAGGDGDDPGSAGKSFYYTPQFAPKPETIRVGYAPVDFDAWAEPETRPVFRRALEVIRDIGVKLNETRLPVHPYNLVAETIIAAEGSSVFEPLLQSGEVNQLADPLQIAGLKVGLELSAVDYLKAMRLRRVIQESVRSSFTDFEVLVSPATFTRATRLSEALDTPSPTPPGVTDKGLYHLDAAGNLAGWPALSLPCGFAGGLPVALQLVSRPYTENTLLLVGREFQKRTDFHRQRPPGL